MIAAESGDEERVKNLIDEGVQLDIEVEGYTATSLAFERNNHNIVLALLKSNAKFPRNYCHERASDELKKFVKLSSRMHRVLKSSNRDPEKFLKRKIHQNPNLRHFYSTENVSLAKAALLSGNLEIYELLLKYNIFFGAHERIDDLILSRGERIHVRDINTEYVHNIYSEEIIILLRNCKFGRGNSLNNKTSLNHYKTFTRNAFDYLFGFNLIAIILKIVAAAQDFKIIFDFARDSVEFLDPNSDEYTKGVFHFNDRIYIAAKDILNPENFYKITSVMAHEFCHYAMYLVYQNKAKPYLKNDKNAEKKFQAIYEECRENRHKNGIIENVFCYPDKDVHHAELIVCVVHIIALKRSENVLTQNFKSLHDFYRVKCMPQMEKELSKIKKKYDPHKRMIRKLMWIFLIFSIITSLFLYNPTYTWSELNETHKLKFMHANLVFHDVQLKIRDIFANDSIVFDLLSSEHIQHGLDENINGLSEAIKNHYNHHIHLSYLNMTEDLKKFFVSKPVNFQGQEIPLNEILRNFSILNSLSTNDIQNFLNGNLLKISKATEKDSKFFIDRSFMVEEVKSFGNQSKHEKGNEPKIFLLSNHAGEGKSIVMRNFAISLKKNYPRKWIQFIDLKDHLEIFKGSKGLQLNQSEALLNFLSSNLFSLNDLEKEIFSELFRSSEVIFLWDGIDEISPLWKNIILVLIETIKSTNNFQYISTRPYYAKEIEEKFSISSHKLVPLNKHERFEYITKFIAIEIFGLNADEFWHNYKDKKIVNKELQDVITKSQKILRYIENSNTQNRLISNPLLLRMIAEISSCKTFNVSRLNIYEIFDIFIREKLKRLYAKGEIVANDFSQILTKSNTNILVMHQALALKQIFPNVNTSYLQIMGNISKFSFEQISRLGILEIKSEEDFHFIHQTFAEFFVAQFIVGSIDKIDVIKNEDDSMLTAYLLSFILTAEELQVVKSFLISFLKIEKEIPKVFSFLKDQGVSLNFPMDDYFAAHNTYANLVKFFKINHNIDLNESIDYHKFQIYY